MGYRTKSEITADFARVYPACPSTLYDALFQEALERVAHDLNLFLSSASLRLTAETATYALSSTDAAPWYELGTSTTHTTEGMWKVDDVIYRVDADNAKALTPIKEEELSAMDPLWRIRDSGEPQYWYRTASEAGAVAIGFFPKPDTSSDPSDGTGFPRVDMYYRYVPKATQTALPTGLTNYEAVKYWMLHMWATNINDPRREEWREKFNLAKGIASAHLQKFQKFHPTRMRFGRNKYIV